MKNIDMNIMLVDDHEHKRKELIENLIKYGLARDKVFEAASGEEAERLIHEKPNFFDVAVIDQQLGGGIDGIETTRRICAHERDIFPIIFTNIPSNDPQTIEINRAKAYEAGAYRYLYRGDSSEDVIKVKDFVAEISQLSVLSERIGKFYDAQKSAPSLLTQLDIMVALIDRGYKVWYMNAANKRFQNMPELPRSACFSVFLKFGGPTPCRGCIVAQTLADGKNHERIYLHPVDSKARKIRWVYSWTQPLLDENGEPILLDGKPIAVLESSQDLTDSERLKNMPVDEKINHIALALNEKDKRFDRIRIYEAISEGDGLKLIGSFGYPRKIEGIIQVGDYPFLQQSIKHFIKKGEGRVINLAGNKDPVCPGELLENFIHWPLMKGERLLGLLSVSSVKGGRICTEDDLDILPGYAGEIIKALEPQHKDSPILEIEKILSETDNLIIQKRTPEGQLQALIDVVFDLTESDSVNVRYRDENVARLLPIGKGICYETAVPELPLNAQAFPSALAIISGREEINGNASVEPQSMEYRKNLPEKSAKALENINSYCFEPLIFQNRCIGRLALYKENKNHYNDKYVTIIRAISGKLSLALHDYLVNIKRMIKDYAFESSGNGLVFTDLKGNITFVNNAFLKLWGDDDQSNVLAKHFKEFFSDHKEALAILKTLEEKGIWQGETLGKRKDKSYVAVELSISLVKDKTGNALGGIASINDISKRKQLEKVQDSIYRISETAGSVENVDELYPKIHDIISGLIPANNFYIALYDEKNETISFPYFKDDKDPQPPPRKKKKGITEYVLSTGEPKLAPLSVLYELRNQGEIEFFGTPAHDWLGVPLKTTDNKTIGVLAVQNYEEGPKYTEQDQDMLVFVSSQIAMAIQRQQAKDQIKSSLKEKEALLKEIHHRVKNNLAIVSEFFELPPGPIHEIQLGNFLASIKNRIKSMSLIHETLYQTDDISRIDSKLYIEKLVNHLSQAFAGSPCAIQIESHIDDIHLCIDTAIPCGIIINELVTNAYKYAFNGRKEGKIQIRLSSREQNIILTVSDNGIGLPRNLNIENASSLGFQLVNILARQLRASVSLETNQGTAFKIIFPQQIDVNN
ncbi:MAG: GAF domain-containing protein [Acidobacteria bacterium]|nr:GAF domain-containing protein [Acidobacteriota bacterium]